MNERKEVERRVAQRRHMRLKQFAGHRIVTTDRRIAKPAAESVGVDGGEIHDLVISLAKNMASYGRGQRTWPTAGLDAVFAKFAELEQQVYVESEVAFKQQERATTAEAKLAAYENAKMPEEPSDVSFRRRIGESQNVPTFLFNYIEKLQTFAAAQVVLADKSNAENDILLKNLDGDKKRIAALETLLREAVEHHLHLKSVHGAQDKLQGTFYKHGDMVDYHASRAATLRKGLGDE